MIVVFPGQISSNIYVKTSLIGRHFEYLIRIYDVTKPELNLPNLNE